MCEISLLRFLFVCDTIQTKKGVVDLWSKMAALKLLIIMNQQVLSEEKVESEMPKCLCGVFILVKES